MPITLCESLRTLSRQEGTTLFMTMLAAFLIILRRYIGQDDIFIGSAVANRRMHQIEKIIGMIVNNLVLRTDLSGNPTFRELLNRVRQVTLEAFANEDLPFDKVVEVLKPIRNLSYNPLFQVMFSFHDSPRPDLTLPNLNITTNVALSNKSTKFDLDVVLIPQYGKQQGITAIWEYNTDLFDAATIQQMVEQYQSLLEVIVANPEQRISDLPLLTQSQKQLLMKWNQTHKEYSSGECIHKLFEAQVELTPDAVAVEQDGQKLTYRELSDRSNKIAHYLQSLGVKPETLVGICVERSLDTIAGLLGILKAGGAYVPLDPAYPQERIADILADTQLGFLLAQDKFQEKLLGYTGKTICLDTDWEVIATHSTDNPISEVQLAKQLFKYQTIAELAAVVGITRQINAEQELVTGSVRLTPIQHWFFEQKLPEPNYFNQSALLEVPSDVQPELLQQVVQQLLAHHDALRLRFVQEGENWLQINAATQESVPLSVFDLSHLSAAEQQKAIATKDAELQASLDLSTGAIAKVALFQLGSDRQKGFDLAQAPLMRFTIIQLTEQKYQLIWSHHHILFDGWSMQIVLKEVLAFYEANQRGEHLRFQRVRPYREYIEWLQQQDSDKAKNFWQKTLQGFETPTLLGGNKGSGTYHEQRFQLSQTVTEKLQFAARQHHLTLNNLVQGAWALLISRYSGESDIVFGATVSGRPPTFEQVDSMVGLLINTLPIRTQVNGKTELLSWLKQLQTQALEQEQYAYFSLAEIQQLSDIPTGLPLFKSILIFENYPLDSAKQETKTTLEMSHISCFERTNYPITLLINPGSQLAGRIVYDNSCFDEQAIDCMIGHFQILLGGMANNLQQYISQLSLLSADKEKEIITLENHQQINCFNYTCFHVLFEEQVEKIPDAIAVVYQQHLTYRELNNRANQLAHYLRSLGVKPEVRVGICVERSLEMVIGILAIFKAGVAYVPLDPAYPTERLAFMPEDVQTPILLTQTHLQNKLQINNQGETIAARDGFTYRYNKDPHVLKWIGI